MNTTLYTNTRLEMNGMSYRCWKLTIQYNEKRWTQVFNENIIITSSTFDNNPPVEITLFNNIAVNYSELMSGKTCRFDKEINKTVDENKLSKEKQTKIIQLYVLV